VSFSDRPTLTRWQKLGCLVYLTIGVLITPIFFLVSVLGGCPAFASPDCRPLSDFALFMWFPGSLILILAGGFAMLKLFMRDRG
jgi:hypothetical protein